MGLTKRRDSYDMEFPLLDDGKTLTLARGVSGAKLNGGRWVSPIGRWPSNRRRLLRRT